MTAPPRAIGFREHAVVVAAAAALAITMTFPLITEMGRVGRVDNGDGQFSIWNVAWVARTLVADPAHVFDANIFYPHKRTLAYSESNLGAGALAVPAYWLTKNPFFAHNVVFLLSFALSAIGMYHLSRFLQVSRAAASVSAIAFAFCPYVFAHTPHIQLLMTAGLPFAMLGFHRMVERPTAGRGATLGALMAAEAISCGYYGVFLVLMVGFAALVVAAVRRLWLSLPYWRALGVGAVVAIVLVLPAFLPYVSLERVSGFHRELEQARQFSSNWSDYFASSSYAHVWMLQYLQPWVDVCFPGFVSSLFGAAGLVICLKRRGPALADRAPAHVPPAPPGREIALIYGGLAILAAWASFGPAGVLYSILYRIVPLFAWLRAPSRFGLVVALALAVLAGQAVDAFARRFRWPALVAAIIALATAGELSTPLPMRPVVPFDPVYRTLATLPPAAVIEVPFYPDLLWRHTQYMLNSTTHWMPIVNGYSDFIPPDFMDEAETLKYFPSGPSIRLLGERGVRYAVIHMYGYNEENRRDVLIRLKDVELSLRPLYVDDFTRLYEIVKAP